MTTELAKVPSWDETFRREVDFVARSYELEAIYAEHGGADTARKSASAVMPGSIVLVEGANVVENEDVKNGKRAYLYDTAASIGLTQLADGPESAKYLEQKQTFLDYLTTMKIKESDGPDLWQKTLLSILIEKDCVVLPADFDHRIQQIQPDEATQLWDNLRSFGEFDTRLLVKGSIGSLYRRALTAQYGFINAHHTREWAAVANGTMTLARICQFAPFGMDAMARSKTNSDKYQAYFIWGTSHRESLNSELQYHRLQAATTCLDDDYESSYKLPINFEEAVRQAANSGALAFVLRTVVSLSGISNKNNEMARNLKNDVINLNIPEEDVIKFFIRAVQLINHVAELKVHRPFILARKARRHWTAAYNGNGQNIRSLVRDIGLDPDIYLLAPFAHTQHVKSQRSDLVSTGNLAENQGSANHSGVLISR